MTGVSSAGVGEIRLSTIGYALIRQHRLAWTALGLATAAFVLPPLIRGRTFTSNSSFVPQARKAPGGLSGLAAQLGLAGIAGDFGPSPAFYADLLQSDQLLGDVVAAPLKLGATQASTTLMDVYRITEETEPLRRERTVRRLRRDLTVTVNQRTNVVRISVRARSAEIAQRVNGTLLDLLNRFNLENRQGQAGAERRFAERRLNEVRDDLRLAEDRLQSFLQRNREYRNASELTFQKERLAREVTIQQQLYSSLAQAFEQAKLEEVRDTPVIMVVEQPSLPAKADSLNLLLNAVFGLGVGAVVGTVLALLSMSVAGTLAPEGVERAELFRLWRAAVGRITRRDGHVTT